MSHENFFESPREHSLVKARIVSKYFSTWAKIIADNMYPKYIIYLDLFAGRGRYGDGSMSTPLMVLQKAIGRDSVRPKFRGVFNDADEETTAFLEKQAQQVEGYETLRYPPRFHTTEVGKDVARQIRDWPNEPMLVFLDPFGYKGLSLDLVNAVLEKRGSEVIFFFNFQRFNPAVSNPYIVNPINDLLGEERADKLRTRFETEALHADERRTLLMESIEEALTSSYGEYVLPFRFYSSEGDGNRLTHHLIHVTKHPLGYEKMKDIMAREGDDTPAGIPAYEFKPKRSYEMDLFETPMEDLRSSLTKDWAGRQENVKKIYLEHGLEKRYTIKHYKTVLMQMEEDGAVTADPPASERRSGTLADSTIITFTS